VTIRRVEGLDSLGLSGSGAAARSVKMPPLLLALSGRHDPMTTMKAA
jgi:hypothetical protein